MPCQGFFQDHLATSDFSVRLASEVLHFTWDWDPLTFLPAGEIAEMSRTLKNVSALYVFYCFLYLYIFYYMNVVYFAIQNIGGMWKELSQCLMGECMSG
jgi:hypothetical protein